MAKDRADAETQEFDLGGLYNDENPLESLGELDLGDDVDGQKEPVDESTEPDEPETTEEPGEDEADSGEGGESEAEEPEAGEGYGSVEDEAADDAEAETQAEEPEPQPKQKEPFIPKSRFDQRTAQLRAAERELEEVRRQLQEAETEKQRAEREANSLTDEQIQAKMNEANTALLEGNTEKAAQLQSEVMGALRQGSQAVEQGGGQSIDPNKIAADVRDQMVFEQTLEGIYEKYPVFNENSDQFNEELSQEAVDLQAYYFHKGYTRAEATEKAADAVAKIHDLFQPSAAAEPGSGPSKKVSLAKQAQKQATKEKVSKARKAPPETSGSAGRSDDSADSLDIEALSVDDWAALPDSVRSRLLGDTI